MAYAVKKSRKGREMESARTCKALLPSLGWVKEEALQQRVGRCT